jgi:hypothetical protein
LEFCIQLSFHFSRYNSLFGWASFIRASADTGIHLPQSNI